MLIASWILVFALLARNLAFDPLQLTLFWLLAVGLITGARAGARQLDRDVSTRARNTVVVGAGDVGQGIARQLLTRADDSVNFVGFVDSAPKARGDDLRGLPVLGATEQLPAIVERFDVDRVIVAFTRDSHETTVELTRSLSDLGVQVDIVPRLFDALDLRVGFRMMDGLPLVSLPPHRPSRAALIVKRTADLVVASVALLALAPLLLLIVARIRLDSAGPAVYRSECVGRHGRVFAMLKFRTMYLEACQGGRYGGALAEESFRRLMDNAALREEFDRTHKLRDDPRVTRFGKFLRRTSLDELPQLLNVVRGEMSLVGPRPINTGELARYGVRGVPPQHLRPGITGYWQVSGRSNRSYDERLKLDAIYASSWSLQLDLTILVRTVTAVLSRREAC